MKIEKIDIYKLKPAKYNPRQVSKKQFKDIKKSVEKFGLVDPIIINSNYTIIGGHQRYKICKELNFEQIDCVVLDLSLEQERELNIRLNKNSGEFDMDILANEFDVDDLVEWGFKHIDLGINIDKLFDDDERDNNIPEIKKSKVKQGDVWQLGNHRLMCGDSNKKEADIVFTDPPYNIEKQDYHKNIYEFTKDAHVFIMHDDKGIVDYLRKSQLEFLRFFIADFTFSSPRGNDPYLNHIIISQEKKDKAIKHQNLHDGFSSIIKMKYRGTITNEDIFHKHQKPVDFVQKFIKHFSLKDNIVMDLFLGSGSTIIASEKLERKCYGMELDKNCCDVIIKRWENFARKKAIKL